MKSEATNLDLVLHVPLHACIVAVLGNGGTLPCWEKLLHMGFGGCVLTYTKRRRSQLQKAACEPNTQIRQLNITWSAKRELKESVSRILHTYMYTLHCCSNRGCWNPSTLGKMVHMKFGGRTQCVCTLRKAGRLLLHLQLVFADVFSSSTSIRDKIRCSGSIKSLCLSWPVVTLSMVWCGIPLVVWSSRAVARATVSVPWTE